MRKMRMLTALALAGGLCLSGASAAMADEEPLDYVKGTADTAPEAAITKMLKVPVGTEIPTAAFTFEFTPVTVDDEDWDKVKGSTSNMPPIGDQVVSISDDDEDTGDTETHVFAKESSDFVAGIAWLHAGVYVYTITEKNTAQQYVTYSPAKYEVTFWIDNCTTGDACTSNGLYVAGVGVAVVTGDEEGEASGKVDPTPEGGLEFDYSQVIFTNHYVKRDIGDPEVTSDHQLLVSKEVTGDYASQEKYFTFTFTMNKPATGVPGAVTYMAYVVEASTSGPNDWDVKTTEENCTPLATDETPAERPYCAIQADGTTPVTIKLKHGQAVAFADLHVGASYTVVETYDDHYEASVVVVEDGEELSEALTPDELGGDLSTGKRVIHAGPDSAAFTNERVESLPTGLRLNDLPFVGLIVLGLAVLVLVTVTRRGKSHA